MLFIIARFLSFLLWSGFKGKTQGDFFTLITQQVNSVIYPFTYAFYFCFTSTPKAKLKTYLVGANELKLPFNYELKVEFYKHIHFYLNILFIYIQYLPFQYLNSS